MELTFIMQSTAFIYSLLLGVALGLLYSPFKILRMFFCFGKTAVFVSDIIYMLLASLAVFIFSIAFLQGYVRVYLYLGCFTGFLTYRLTIGMLFSKIYGPIFSFIRKISHKIQIKIKKFTKKLLKIGDKILYNVSNKRRIFSNRRLKSSSNKRVMAGNEKRKDKFGKTSEGS